MPAVSQALVDFANAWRQPPAPGFEIIETPRYRIVLQPDFPVPGPNSASWGPMPRGRSRRGDRRGDRGLQGNARFR